MHIRPSDASHLAPSKHIHDFVGDLEYCWVFFVRHKVDSSNKIIIKCAEVQRIDRILDEQQVSSLLGIPVQVISSSSEARRLK